MSSQCWDLEPWGLPQAWLKSPLLQRQRCEVALIFSEGEGLQEWAEPKARQVEDKPMPET